MERVSGETMKTVTFDYECPSCSNIKSVSFDVEELLSMDRLIKLLKAYTPDRCKNCEWKHFDIIKLEVGTK